jgi:hypothetical protein
MPGADGTPGSAGMPSTGMPGFPGSSGSSSGSGQTAGGSSGTMAGGGSSGGQGGAQGGAAGGDDPFAGLGNPGSGGMTAAQRRAALDARLEEGYAVFDGAILAERERAQGQANEAGSAVMGTGGGDGEGEGSESGGFESGGEATTVASATNNSTGGRYLPSGAASGREGEFSNQPTFPVPGDIPSGDDDDVVARQLREAALHEPDPELREKLWNEYRKYTGLAQ